MTKKHHDDLYGFRDFLNEKDTGKKNKKSTNRYQNEFELLTFLEQDSKRLSKHIDLFEEKNYVLKNYPQDPSLNIEVEHNTIEARVEAIQLNSQANAPLFKNLSDIFKNFF